MGNNLPDIDANKILTEPWDKETLFHPRQELFCRYYTQNNELFGNGTLSYAEAYDYKLDELSKIKPVTETNDKGEPSKWGDSDYTLAYNVCSVNASRLLRNDKIQARLTKLLNEYMKDEVIDAELLKVIISGKDTDKVAAIREYNKLRQRIVEKTDITSKGEKISSLPVGTMTDEQVNEFLKNKINESTQKPSGK